MKTRFVTALAAVAVLCVAIVALATGSIQAAVPSDWIVVERDKKGNVTGYVTHKEDIAQLTRDFCTFYPDNVLPYPNCFMDPGGPESEDDEDEDT